MGAYMAENEISTIDWVRERLSLAQDDVAAVGKNAAEQHDGLADAPQMLAELISKIDEATLLTQALRKLSGNNGIHAHYSMRAIDAKNRVQSALGDAEGDAAHEVMDAVLGLADKQYALEDLVSYDRPGNSGLLAVFSHLQNAKGKLLGLQDSGFNSLVSTAAEVRDLSGAVGTKIEEYKGTL